MSTPDTDIPAQLKKCVPLTVRLSIALISICLIIAAYLFARAGEIPLIGALFVGIAPDLLLIGACGLVAISVPTSRAVLMTIVFVICLPVLGINTRLPSIYSDLNLPGIETTSSGPFLVPTGSWIKLESNALSIKGRVFPYAGALRSCVDDPCFRSNGFRMPHSGVPRDYWQENIRDSVLQNGLSLSGSGKPFAYIKVSQQFADKERYVLHLEALDNKGEKIAHASEYHRIGFPYESPDDTEYVGAVEYLLHANIFSRWVARSMGFDNPYPVLRLLDKAFSVPEPQDTVAHSMSMTFDVNHPKAESVDAKTYTSKVLLPLQYPPLSESCSERLKIRGKDNRRIPEYINGIPASGSREWWPFKQGAIAIRLVKDESGKLIAFIGGNVILKCDNTAVYAITDGLEPYIGHIFRFVKFNYQGTVQFALTANIKDPEEEWSVTELPSLDISESRLAFTRWYLRMGSGSLVRRQAVEITYPAS